MKLIKSSVEILEQEPGIEGIYKQIEKAGRTAYKSENYITEGSAEKFVNMIKNKNHGACLEHGTVYLLCKDPLFIFIGEKYKNNKYSNVI
jgi:thymidylate synthase (FAD)